MIFCHLFSLFEGDCSPKWWEIGTWNRGQFCCRPGWGWFYHWNSFWFPTPTCWCYWRFICWWCRTLEPLRSNLDSRNGWSIWRFIVLPTHKLILYCVPYLQFYLLWLYWDELRTELDSDGGVVVEFELFLHKLEQNAWFAHTYNSQQGYLCLQWWCTWTGKNKCSFYNNYYRMSFTSAWSKFKIFLNGKRFTKERSRQE